MNPLQNWAKGFLAWIFCSLLCSASALPIKEANTQSNHSCTLNKINFQNYIKNCTYRVAKEARVYDKDTDNRLIDQYLYTKISEKDHCYLMKRVTETIVTNVLSQLKSPPTWYSNVHEVADFLVHLNRQLNGCTPLGEKEQIENNLKRMEDKLDELGQNGKTKAIGELDLLFEYLESACAKMLKPTKQRSNKN